MSRASLGGLGDGWSPPPPPKRPSNNLRHEDNMSQTTHHELSLSLSNINEQGTDGRDDKPPNPATTRIRKLLASSSKQRTTNERLSQFQSQPLLGCLSFSRERKEGEEEVVEVKVGDGD